MRLHYTSKPGRYNLGKIRGSIDLDENFAYFLGCIAGDGFVSHRELQFVASEISVFKAFLAAFDNSLGRLTTVPDTRWTTSTPKECKIWRWRLFSLEAANLVYSITGMRGKAQGKAVPDIVLAASIEIKVAYLRGLFDCDGSVSSGKVIYVATSSEGQSKSVSFCLALLGITSTITAVVKKDTVPHYQVRIFNRDNVQVFIDRIGFTNPKKMQRIEKNYESHMKLPSVVIKYLQANYAELGTWLNGIREGGSSNSLTQDELRLLLKKLSPADRVKLSKLLKVNMHLTTVKSIEKQGVEPVFDLTVKDDHCYVANEIYVHNSNNAWVWVAPKEFSPISVLDINQVKARNQLRFPFQLMSINDCMRIQKVDERLIAEQDYEDQSDNSKEKNRSKSTSTESKGSSSSRSRSGKARKEHGRSGGENSRSRHTDKFGSTRSSRNKATSESDDEYLEDISEAD